MQPSALLVALLAVLLVGCSGGPSAPNTSPLDDSWTTIGSDPIAPALLPGGLRLNSIVGSDHRICGVATDSAAYCWIADVSWSASQPAREPISRSVSQLSSGGPLAALAIAGAESLPTSLHACRRLFCPVHNSLHEITKNFGGHESELRQPRHWAPHRSKDANHYLELFRAQWDDRLDRLEAYVARLQQKS